MTPLLMITVDPSNPAWRLSVRLRVYEAGRNSVANIYGGERLRR